MANKIRLADPLENDSIVNGEGLRMVVWTQGCLHNCLECHNPKTHSMTGGFLKDIDELKQEILQYKYCDGLTLSGGDPFFQIDESLEIAKFCKDNSINVWAYTGFTYEQLITIAKTNPNILELLKNIDVLIDGKFILEQKSLDIKFCGSRNQRIINVASSLKKGKAVLVKKYLPKKINNKDEEHLFI